MYNSLIICFVPRVKRRTSDFPAPDYFYLSSTRLRTFQPRTNFTCQAPAFGLSDPGLFLPVKSRPSDFQTPDYFTCQAPVFGLSDPDYF